MRSSGRLAGGRPRFDDTVDVATEAIEATKVERMASVAYIPFVVGLGSVGALLDLARKGWIGRESST